jgi:hypothetical protein
MGGPTSSYATTGIALRISGALKPHHHDKVETPSVESDKSTSLKYFSFIRKNYTGHMRNF